MVAIGVTSYTSEPRSGGGGDRIIITVGFTGVVVGDIRARVDEVVEGIVAEVGITIIVNDLCVGGHCFGVGFVEKMAIIYNMSLVT